VLGYVGGFFDYEIKRTTSIQELTPEQRFDRGEFEAIYERTIQELQNAHVTRALLKTCEDCEPGRLEIVREWIENSASAYTNIEVTFEDVPDPILSFFDGDKELFKITIATLTSPEIDEILNKVGVTKNDDVSSFV